LNSTTKIIAELHQENHDFLGAIFELSSKNSTLSEDNLTLSKDNLTLSSDNLTLSEEKESLLTQQKNWLLEKEALAEQLKILSLELKLALAAKYARSAEKYKFDDRQGSLFDEPEVVAEVTQPEEVEDEEAHPKQKRRKPGRKRLPEYLPRVRKEYTLPEAELTTADGFVFSKIGEEVTEELEFIPAKVQIIEHARFKYACKEREEYGVKIAPMGERVIAHGIASPSLLAHVLVQKYCYHMPLYRQEKQWAELDIELGRSTLCNWVMQCGKLLEPVYEAIKKEVLNDKYIHVDETPVTVLTHGKDGNNRRQSYMWVYGNSVKDLIFYDYQQTRAGSHAYQVLQNFKGHIQADAYAGYDQVYVDAVRKEVGCWAHARRKFHDIIKVEAKHKQASYVLKEIAKLYRLEADIREHVVAHRLRDERIKQWREIYSVPILNKLESWMREVIEKTLPKSLLGKAIAYTLKNWEALTEYTKYGYLNIDNNFAENAIRPFALGRKNWLFHGNHNGARAAAIIYSILQSAKANGLKPHEYMTYLLENIKSTPASEIAKLLPHEVSKAHPHLLLKSRPPR
jgi:transposase